MSALTMSMQLAEGQEVSIALRDGTLLASCTVVSRARKSTTTVWLVVNDEDVFVPIDDIAEIREPAPRGVKALFAA